ncbi:MAG: hypothetical protein J5998_06325, partial [Clostridia bacterium]|nr:hypothetical protein [Clostridia bacterium]
DRLADGARTSLVRLAAFFARVADGFLDVLGRALMGVAAFFTRLADSGVDTLLLGLWRSVFGWRKKSGTVPVGNRFTYALGRLFDGAIALLNRTVCRRRPITTSFVYVFAAGWQEMSANLRRITVSVSFGLLLLSVGLFIAFDYLLR